MSATLVDVRSRLKRPPLLIADRDDRWLTIDMHTRRITAAALLVMALSIALHALFVVAALFQAPAAVAPHEQAVSVEVVKQMPDVMPPRPAPIAGMPKPAPAPPSKPETTTPKPAASPQSPEAASTLKADAVKNEAAKTEAAKTQSVENAASKPNAAKDAAAAELASLKQELAALQTSPPASSASDEVPGEQDGLGTEPGQQATALPGLARDGEGDLVGYTAVVFSQLAKAKAIGTELGIPGTAGIRFAVDEHGNLTTVALATSSGIARLDEQAMALVRKAAPFPAPPAGAQRDFTANVSFVAGLNR